MPDGFGARLPNLVDLIRQMLEDPGGDGAPVARVR